MIWLSFFEKIYTKRRDTNKTFWDNLQQQATGKHKAQKSKFRINFIKALNSN